jgi:hypothetical protein
MKSRCVTVCYIWRLAVVISSDQTLNGTSVEALSPILFRVLLFSLSEKHLIRSAQCSRIRDRITLAKRFNAGSYVCNYPVHGKTANSGSGSKLWSLSLTAGLHLCAGKAGARPVLSMPKCLQPKAGGAYDRALGLNLMSS